ncbi:hypothetical protein MUK42_23430 [Musa troglodytarum]|uniref:Transcription factor n=1 Tax=Musa troglodytarum TaxID=320322 RepID=A0A9E7EXQ4_9LILI|nr:hypothetical protein MUK42_23430 [Musa troglodytarum]
MNVGRSSDLENENRRDTNGLTVENNELKLRLQTMEQQVHLQDALNEALREEVQRLKLATGQMLPNGGQMVNLVPSSFGANQQFYHHNQGMQSLLAAHQLQQLQIHSQHPQQLQQPHQTLQQPQQQQPLHPRTPQQQQQQQQPPAADLRMKGPLASQNQLGETASDEQNAHEIRPLPDETKPTSGSEESVTGSISVKVRPKTPTHFRLSISMGTSHPSIETTQ